MCHTGRHGKGQVGFAVIVGAYAGTAPATMAEMLPGSVRVSGTALGYNLCMALEWPWRLVKQLSGD